MTEELESGHGGGREKRNTWKERKGPKRGQEQSAEGQVGSEAKREVRNSSKER